MDKKEPLRGTTSWHEEARRWVALAALVLVMAKSAWDEEPPVDVIIAVVHALFG